MEPTPFFDGIVRMLGERSPREEKAPMTRGAAAYLKERAGRELYRMKIPTLPKPRSAELIRQSFDEHYSRWR